MKRKSTEERDLEKKKKELERKKKSLTNINKDIVKIEHSLFKGQKEVIETAKEIADLKKQGLNTTRRKEVYDTISNLQQSAEIAFKRIKNYAKDLKTEIDNIEKS